MAIIMDGNGRWAKARGLDRSEGHRAGADRVPTVTRWARSVGVRKLTVFAFSTENWSRPANEVDFLMKLIEGYFADKVHELIAENVMVRAIGRRDRITHSARERIADVEGRTRDGGFQLDIAIDYGGQDDLLQAVRGLAQEGAGSDEITFQSVSERVQLRPAIDLMLRTGGERRLSNFGLHALAQSELIFTDVLWPDIDEFVLNAVLAEFARRRRRWRNAIQSDG